MNRAIAAANQISPISRPQTPSSRVQHLKNVKRNLGLDEEMIYCPVCVYPATKHANNKGKIQDPIELGITFIHRYVHHAKMLSFILLPL